MENDKLRQLVSELANLKADLEETEAAVKVKKQQIEGIMSGMDINEVLCEDARGRQVKAVLIPEGETKRFDRKKATESFLTKGIAPDVVKGCFESGETVIPRKPYIRMTFGKACGI